ncbi:MAG: aminotransferase class I/II-fold pyridoxal phosphate-dependent enzyme [Bacteroidetes bacterium]|nr:MAG: aminotransferase class I/II-fold pyridoxal phosphate-dependent enzyme [Bacteroidota bacterium]
MEKPTNPRKFETEAIRTQLPRSEQGEHAAPLYLTSSFVFEDAEQMRARFADEDPGNIYSRFSNPNTTELIEKVCRLEGTEAGWATATGMAAVFTAIAALCDSGSHILACRSVFGSTHQLLTKVLPRWQIGHTYVDIAAPRAAWEAALQPQSRVVLVETPSNPGVDLIDLQMLGDFARDHDLILMVDNCFATPYLQQPARFGAHLVLHSATKFMDGQGRVLGGLIMGSTELIAQVQAFARHSGPAMSPFNAWVLSKSLETLAVRMDRHSTNALTLAEWLEGHPAVTWVKYPFLPSHPRYALAKKQMRLGGGVFSFELKGGLEAGRRFLDALQMCSLTANLGDSRTIVTHPASTTHARLQESERAAVGITPGLVRVSVGLEHVDDIRADLAQALKA